MDMRKPSVLAIFGSVGKSLFVLLLLVAASSSLVRTTEPNALERVLASGKLSVLSSNGATTYYEGTNGLTGFEYNLLKGFADSLGVKLVIKDQPELGKMLAAVEGRRVDFASAGLTAVESQGHKLTFAKPYMQITQQLIFNRHNSLPTSIKDLEGKEVLILADSAHTKRVQRLQKKFPKLQWRLVKDAEMIDLLEMVHSGEADYAVVDSDTFELNRYSYPSVQLAFDITNPQPLAWAFPTSRDDSLYQAAQSYMAQIKRDGTLAQVTKHFFNHIEELTTTDAMVFAYRLQSRLPQWSESMKAAADQFDLDWQLLAAIGYQESHWLADAESHTGVKGLMMLTQSTAKAMGVADREDPAQSILGGAKYLRRVLNRLPERIQGEDRLSMALAAYNQGMGHLEDARVLTQRMGDDPDKWSHVRKYMPLLAKAQYYSKAKHGYMRGWEPVAFVDNVLNYHKILAWHEKRAEIRLAANGSNTLGALTSGAEEATEASANSNTLL